MTTSTTPTTDPRPDWFAALEWVNGLAAAVGPDRMADPTPCDGFDVRTLLAHLVTTVRRPLAVARGTDAMAYPLVSEDVLGDPVTAYAAECAAAREAWSGAGGAAALDRTARVPWGEVPGRAALGGFLNETLVHGWDLAVATGQDPETDPELADRVLTVARATIPATPRGGAMPFGPVVPSAPDAGPTERLANWSGHGR
ncbi:TIGR03086 family metal-binding protein [Pseudonocardia nematodicida]|uniref:TIGR03086 family metal-binding protein n=1 Tax=Pseudonocardia nematodicida TaxID=1206997 RepID=A0ABV1KBK9_9PSEU